MPPRVPPGPRHLRPISPKPGAWTLNTEPQAPKPCPQGQATGLCMHACPLARTPARPHTRARTLLAETASLQVTVPSGFWIICTPTSAAARPSAVLTAASTCASLLLSRSTALSATPLTVRNRPMWLELRLAWLGALTTMSATVSLPEGQP